MKSRTVAFVVFIAGGMLNGQVQAEEAQLPPAVQTLVDRTVRDVARERQKYEASAKVITDRLVVALAKEVERQTKAGKLKAALAVQNELEEVMKGKIIASVDADARKAKPAAAKGKAGLTIKSAKFGINDVWFDCTDDIRALVKDGCLEFTYHQQMDLSLAQKHGDPAPGFVESLVIEYDAGNGVKTITVGTNGKVSLP
ncbi:MAG: hypothetical protein WCL44_11450 [bacterium]